MNKVEILAPVGGREQLEAAVRCGADAVYLGGKGFNARRNAENFTETSLADAVSYAHARNVRVHVTVNTLVLDCETEALEQEIRSVAESGADAAIIQDMTVMRMFERKCPTVERHASTQAVVHNSDGAKYMRDLGYSRVVLARELSLKEIEKIISRVDGIDYEVFVHGALCTCLSGACYLSSMLGGRSGNRGLCAQPCRLDFRCNSVPYAISLKDMSYIDHIHALSEAGVMSFKIEGRMKRPEYVAAAVTACRNAIEGKPYDFETLRSVFSRGGFTQGYLLGKRGPDMQGIRTKEDAEASADVLGRLRETYRNERRSVPVDISVKVKRDEPVSLTAVCGGISVSAAGPVPETALNTAITAERIIDSCKKTGGTPFISNNVNVELDGGITVGSAVINNVRREALGRILEMRSAVKPHAWNASAELPAFVPHITGTKKLRARFETVSQIADPEVFDMIYLPVEEIARHPEIIAAIGDRLIGEMPHALFPENEDDIETAVIKLRDAGLSRLSCDNVYAIEAAKRLGMMAYGGPGLNITNTNALNEYHSAGLEDAVVSFELNNTDIKSLGGNMPRGAIAYGYLPLMRLRRCPNRGKNGCGSCKGRGLLNDRKGVDFPLLCHERRYTTVLNSVPLWTADKPIQGIDFEILYFTIESADDIYSIIKAHTAGLKTERPHTYGLYGRKLL